MKKKFIMIFLFIAIIFSSVPFLAKGETKTETVLEEYNIIFDWGYVYYFTETTPAKQTEVTLEISSDQSLIFFVCNKEDAENYANGEEIDVYYVNYDVSVTTLTFVLDEKRTYDFAFDNTNSENAAANIDYVIITFTYETSSSGWIVWVIILAAVIGFVILIVKKRSKPTAEGYIQPSQYTAYEPPSTVQQTYQQPVTRKRNVLY
ncbi:MAG: hypothetical protein ACTSSL_09280 [Candidatus Heimdallarchaeaceae archaeon]